MEVYYETRRHPAGILRGEPNPYVEPTIDLQIPERAQLAEILCKQPGDLTPVQLPGLRIRAAELMVALYDKRETKKRDAVGRRPPAKIVVKEESLRPDPFPY
ncbi:hypothetical protein QBC42DRAFT_297852 [Cladorrhinum samala]|uniref:Uncharacterized protein n=1 Tax=Cladorrhinum samala TaxID=585594 RepID=A0AAV9HKE0_9PEZI|nr:hypothetical protein QBC42DRAFT_297852 [Cladorrhinum samala]